MKAPTFAAALVLMGCAGASNLSCPNSPPCLPSGLGPAQGVLRPLADLLSDAGSSALRAGLLIGTTCPLGVVATALALGIAARRHAHDAHPPYPLGPRAAPPQRLTKSRVMCHGRVTRLEHSHAEVAHAHRS